MKPNHRSSFVFWSFLTAVICPLVWNHAHVGYYNPVSDDMLRGKPLLHTSSTIPERSSFAISTITYAGESNTL